MKSRYYFALAIAISLLVSNALPSIVLAQQDQTANQEDDLQKRLTFLEEKLETKRKEMNIPGMAIAVVKDGEVIMAKGFGVSDVEKQTPVTPKTLFAIGSSTKAFTATVIGMLEDEGKIKFDDPVTEHVPGFKLQVDTGDEEITIRDLLCHRTGFSRMGVLWGAAKDTSRQDVIGLAANAEPTKKFRENFQYNNVMYLTAGYSAGQAADSTWEDLIETRLLKPLGMDDSDTSITSAQKDERLSLGYRWDEDKKEYVLLPMRNLDLIGPAGSINSNVSDMANWVKFQLSKGEINGQRLIKEETLAETWKPQIKMAEGAGSYGLGWMIQDWNDKKVVEHGGNIDGFGAQVALLPEENLGFVLLTNVTVTPLQQGSIGIVFDTLAGELPKPGEELTVDTSKLVGNYKGNFGAIDGQTLKVLMKNGKLAVDVPNQRVFELKSPDEEGKWYFALTNAIAVSFATDDDGNTTAMFLHQGGLDLECPREGVERPIEYPLEKMRPLLGTYHDEENDLDVAIQILDNRLVAEIPKQGKVEFFPPDDDGKWAMRAKRDMLQIRFNKDEDGTIVSFTRFQGGKESEIKRTEVAEEAKMELPTADEVMASIMKAHGLDDLAEIGTVRLTGTAKFVNQGAQGEAELTFTGAEAFYTKIELGKLGYMRESTEGDLAWADSAFAPFEEKTGKQMAMAKLRHPLWFAGNWQEIFESPVVTKTTKLDGKEAVVLKFAGKDMPSRTLYVDSANGQILKEDWALLMAGIGQMPIEISYEDYRSAGTVMLPFRQSLSNAASGKMLIQYDSEEQVDETPNYNWSRE